MKNYFLVGLMFAMGLVVATHAAADSASGNTGKMAPKNNTGLEAAKAICKVTGVAMSPLLGTSAVGAWDFFTTSKEKRGNLSWYAQPVFWVPALLMVGLVGCKDVFGSVLPPGFKKPLDVLETVENKVSGLVAGGAFVPMVATVFHSAASSASQTAGHWNFAAAGFGAIDLTPLLNVFTVPVALVAYALVWCVSHTVHVLILISPFGAVDAALKAARTSLISLLTATALVNPYVGAVLSLVIIVVAYFLAGWSFRLTTFGTVFVWDFMSGRRHRFKPAANANWMFTGRKIEKVPIRTYGKLVWDAQGQLTLEFRPWLFLPKQTLKLPNESLAVGRGLLYPEILSMEKVSGEMQTLLALPPRYKGHEEAVAQAYAIADVRDVGLLKAWAWLKSLFVGESTAATATA